MGEGKGRAEEIVEEEVEERKRNIVEIRVGKCIGVGGRYKGRK